MEPVRWIPGLDHQAVVSISFLAAQWQDELINPEPVDPQPEELSCV